MKQSKEQVEAFKLVGKINAGINNYINTKLRKLCELDSSDDDDYGQNIRQNGSNNNSSSDTSSDEESKCVRGKIRNRGKPSKRRRIIESRWDLERGEDEESNVVG